MIAIGLDGFRKGWVAVTLHGERAAIDFVPNISWLRSQPFTIAAIDIPIGLSDDGERACDREARALLRPDGSRVFSGARRWLWRDFGYPQDFSKANQAAAARGQTRVSLQLWHLGPKIIEVDDFVRTNHALDVRETHPELVFRRLNGGQPLPSKHSADGLKQRCDLLRACGLELIDEWLATTRLGSGAKADDVLDACACALAARDLAALDRTERRGDHSDRCVPRGEPPRDDHGLPMQIWY
jgi:predicted RNase H-like nuclease